MTILFAVAAVEDDELVITFASAGHPRPLILRDDGQVERVPVAGPLIGLTSLPEYHAAQVRLGPGDGVLLYTDGLTDARAPIEMLDERQVMELLARADGRRGAELTAFLEREVTAGEDPRDDIAMLLVEMVGPAGAVASPRVGSGQADA